MLHIWLASFARHSHNFYRRFYEFLAGRRSWRGSFQEVYTPQTYSNSPLSTLNFAIINSLILHDHSTSFQHYFPLSFSPTDSLQGYHEKRLLNHLLNNYNLLERPVANESDPLEVRFGLTLQQIIDVVSTKCCRVINFNFRFGFFVHYWLFSFYQFGNFTFPLQLMTINFSFNLLTHHTKIKVHTFVNKTCWRTTHHK